MSMDIAAARIANPKRAADETRDRDACLFPYYAGYSSTFTKGLIGSLGLKEDAILLDPWNGAGTTTRIAAELRHTVIGCDLNPAMVLIAKADLLSPRESPSLYPLAVEVSKVAEQQASIIDSRDPLCQWLIPSSAAVVRSIERQLSRTLVSSDCSIVIPALVDFGPISPLAAMMYLALFRAMRRILSPFRGSNPTWIRRPVTQAHRLRPDRRTVIDAFTSEVSLLATNLANRQVDELKGLVTISLNRADSRRLPIGDQEVDFVVTSPPYCTRIDYAVATAIELAVLGVGEESFDDLRRSLLGTSTVPTALGENGYPPWGESCTRFLESVRSHTSKASACYYYKNHLQYFRGLYQSIGEISRVTRSGGGLFVIIQDSYYKDIHNDLPATFTEMASTHGFSLVRREDFSSATSMANVNPRARQYCRKRMTTESVLGFYRN